MNCNETSTWIDPFLDNELELSRRLDVEQHLKGCADCTRLLQDRRSLQGSLRDPGLRFEVPAVFEHELRDRLRRGEIEKTETPVRGNWLGWWGGFISSAVLTSALFLIVPALTLPFGEARIAQDVTNSHVHSLMAHHLIDVESTDQHTVKPWFNGRIDFAPEVPDLAGEGFRLTGGRLDYINHRPVAALVYYRALHPINLFIWPAASSRQRSIKAATRQGYHLLHWTAGGMTYWVISDLNERELTDFAELLRK